MDQLERNRTTNTRDIIILLLSRAFTAAVPERVRVRAVQ